MITLLLLLAILGFMLFHFEHSQVYHPDRTFRAMGTELRVPFEDVTFLATDNVSLNAWFFPAKTNALFSQWAVLICHGNAGNIGDRLDLCDAWLSVGVNVLLFDYRGYGRSTGRPSEEGTYLDAQAAVRWLGAKGFKPERVVAHGESLGGGVASEVALREKLGGLVLQSTFTSIPDVGAELFPWLPVRWISRIKYDTKARLPRITVPVMVMHSPNDSLIRFHHAQTNFGAANEPKLLWELSGDHNDPVSGDPRFVAGCEEFVGLLSTPSNPRRGTNPAQ